MAPADSHADQKPPLLAGILLGMGLGGFFDGIVLHQILQWHHLFSSAGLAPDSLRNLQINVLADGVFHAATYVFTLVGVILLWRTARRPHGRWPARLLPASLLIGFGLFNLAEGLVNHQWLGIHHVNETAPTVQWLWWDLGFLAWGAAMLAGGAWLLRGLRSSEARGDEQGFKPQAQRPQP